VWQKTRRSNFVGWHACALPILRLVIHDRYFFNAQSLDDGVDVFRLNLGRTQELVELIEGNEARSMAYFDCPPNSALQIHLIVPQQFRSLPTVDQVDILPEQIKNTLASL
jgi:hypothetical protein